MLAPFLGCTTPAAFLALQRHADMPRLVASLSDWNAVRLGALGPLEAEAARVLLKKRAAFLSTAVEKHGLAKAEVLALFVLHTSHDDEVRQFLRLLAEDKLLKRALGAMEVVREELNQRGMALTDFPERDFRAGDIARGLGRAADDVAVSIPLVGGSRSADASALSAQLPPPYRVAYEEVEKAQYLGAFAPGNVALASFDSLTFGVPLGFYHLATGTAQGGASLSKGEYEEATRQLAPAALMVGLYAGGKGARAFREGGLSRREGARLQAVVPRMEALKAVLERLEARIGESAVGELARYFQKSREAALLAAEWGDAAALALYESRGNVPKARQAMLAVANSDRAGPASTQGRDTPGGGASADKMFGRETATSRQGRVEVGSKVDAKDIKGARPHGPDGRPGHPDAHGVSRQDQANIINDPKSTLYRGTNANNRPVDHYHRDGTTVVTEQGEPTRVITAFGTLATKDSRGRPISRGTGKPANPLPSGGPYEKLR
ncbi:HNH endonuclease [Myxococcus faecalis]|uniref:HNH endonuclease n=1 Tax=Myxococcus faecalis TaxID=3115646 RepID=UPI003CEC036B